ncbi:MAG TPA: hypothetical protein VF240_19465 [Pyrinomonadaceae bacterium]
MSSKYYRVRPGISNQQALQLQPQPRLAANRAALAPARLAI